MKIMRIAVIGTVTILFALSLNVRAANFENLNFESANIGSTIFSTSVPVSSALPDWMVTIGGVQQTDVGVNAFSTGAPAVSLIAPGGPLPAIDGDYSVFLTGSTAIASISQTALIPSGTQSLFFEAQQGTGGGGNGALAVTVGTESIPITPVAIEPTYTLYGANLSAWAGDTEDLTFSALDATSGLNNWELDDISFSQTALTPEPIPLILTAIGGLLFAARKRFARR
jgi:hypothetical protein